MLDLMELLLVLADLPILQLSIQNLPEVQHDEHATTSRHRVTSREESEVQLVIRCAKEHDIQVRIRGGGHDYEGLSYTTDFGNPFLTLDLFNMRNVTVYSVEKTAWVGAGSTIGELYYKISEKSPTLGFPAGSCPTVGVGGHFSGGGYGVMLRKYGLAVDQIIDAPLVDAHGRILDRKLMVEDLFWAIRGQREKESLTQFLTRWREEVDKVEEMDDKTVMSLLMNAFRAGELYTEFCRRPPSSYQEVYNTAWEYGEAENLNKRKRELEEGYAKTEHYKKKLYGVLGCCRVRDEVSTLRSEQSSTKTTTAAVVARPGEVSRCHRSGRRPDCLESGRRCFAIADHHLPHC
ncbi:unnamed protein product [Cuscuta campestris]|uniref:FAD-binding PCMH-type domain-containing protein n=1 Tax=Cuscuta campestris TaxID=132261 RepID=A0A484L5J3_9ASTE|nr:unnamed protein product [Cuscuta campestris]